MSDGLKINEAPVITSLPTGTYLMAIDANGQLARITKANATKDYTTITPSKQQWIRIASFTSPGGALLAITSVWNNNPGVRILADCQLHPHSVNYNGITVLSRLINSSAGATFLLKCRVVVARDKMCYLDLYYNSSMANTIYFRAANPIGFTLLNPPEQDAQILEGYTVKEFDISTVGGG